MDRVRLKGAKRFDEPGYRHVMGRVFNRVVRLMAVKGIDDTQCGFKCFQADAASDLFRRQRIRGMGFDAEVLYLAQKKGYTIEEMPIDWYFQTVSKVRPVADTVDMFKDTVLIRLRDIIWQVWLNRIHPTRSPHPAWLIVVPTYNEADNLPELSRRLFALGIGDLHLYVVDDGSPDGTAEVARALCGTL